MFYTYAHLKKTTKELFYIGKGTGNRLHRKDARNEHWHNTVKKHGYEAIVLSYWDKEEDAFEHEKFLISCMKDIGVKLVNQSSGGDGNGPLGGFCFSGKKHTEAAKEKCRQIHLGKPKTEESKKKNAESHKQKICINSLIYKSWQEASAKTGIPTGSISYLLKNKVSPKSKYNWIYEIYLVM
jgi:hypothetical protein